MTSSQQESPNALGLDEVLSDLSIYDDVSKQYMDIFMVVLLEAAGDTLIPKLYEIFGRESFLKFLNVFSGCTVQVPSIKLLEGVFQEVGIYLGLKDLPTGARSQAVQRLAVEYSIPAGQVRRTFVQTEERLSRYSFK